MSITYWTSRDFNQNSSGAKNAAQKGPVFITDRGRPAYVLMAIEEYERITGQVSLLDVLAQVGDIPEFEFEPEKLSGSLHKTVDF
jgi:prevent-host-death family protein